MEPSRHLLSIIFILGTAQGLFLALLLLSKKSNRMASRMLAALMVAYAIALGGIAFQTNDELIQFLLQFPHVFGTIDPLPFLFGPLHYLYVVLLISEKRNLRQQDFLHFLPFILVILYLSPFFLESAECKRAFILGASPDGCHSSNTLKIIFAGYRRLIPGRRAAHGLIYMFATLRLLKRHEQKLKASFSSIETISLRWLQRLTLITASLWGLVVFLLIGAWAGNKLFGNIDHIVSLGLSVAVYAIGYFGLRQPSIFSDGVGKAQNAKKYEHSGLSPEKAEVYLQKLGRAMEKERLFMKSGLTLQELAEKLAISTNHLSQIINERLHKSFYDFVNEYRVQEAQRMLLDPASEKLTLLAIAYEVGFTSKSAFNAAFKKHAQMTPTQFKRKAQNKA